MILQSIARAVSIAVFGGVAFAQGSIFTNSLWYPVGDAPTGSTLADVNNDGHLDFLVANYYSDRVSVMLGDGTGSFTTLPLLSVGGEPRALVVALIDGDNLPDLVTVNPSQHSVSVLLGDGLGGFGAPTQFPAGAFPVDIAAGDMNGDGKLDIAVGNQSAAGIAVLLGDGLGGLGAPIFSPLTHRPERIALADMNADGKLDCVSSSWLDNYFDVLLGNGNGSLSVATSAYSPSPKGLAVGDISGDGKSDVIVASSQYDIVEVYLGTGAGGLSPKQVHYLGSSGHYATEVMIADASGDGRADLIVCGAANKTLTVFIGEGAGAFGFAHTSPILESAYNAVAADLNGDGFADVVTSHQILDSVRVHLGDGVGSWERYCTPKTNSLGCVPRIEAWGTPSVSNPRPFWVYVFNVLDGKVGLFIYAVNGTQASTPFQGGTLCVGPTGIRRAPPQNSSGDPKLPAGNCSGAYALNFNAFAQGLAGGTPSAGLAVLGNSYQMQVWSRDPGFAAPNNTGLSPALDVTPWL